MQMRHSRRGMIESACVGELRDGWIDTLLGDGHRFNRFGWPFAVFVPFLGAGRLFVAGPANDPPKQERDEQDRGDRSETFAKQRFSKFPDGPQHIAEPVLNEDPKVRPFAPLRW